LQLRSPTTRLNCANIARLISAALAVTCLIGCQSNSERDWAARDRRVQEDQMWAMQDYIQQYQQLVCRFRSENASLRRQLNDERTGTVVSPQPTPTRQPSPPPYRNAPPSQPAPGLPPNKQAPAPAPDMPDVPPLQGGSASEPINWSEPFAQRESKAAGFDQFAQLTTYEAPANSLRSTGSDSPAHEAPTMSPEVLLSGEVVENEAGGPRLAIDVETFDESGHAVRFGGSASVAIVNSENGVQQRLARWDFGAEDVRAALDPSAGDPTMHFRVELPAGTKIEGKNQLLVRLVPTTGASLLSHAKLDLSKPGLFSSRTDKIWQSDSSVVAASYDEPAVETETNDAPPMMNEGTWATAAPGKPANLSVDADQPSAGWRAASGPIPDVVVSSTPTTKTWNDQPKRIEQPAPTKATTLPAPVEVARKPAWAPERPGTGTSSRATRPTWSATR
jgi:hypothetical protein